MSNPTVSIIMPIYNAAPWVAETIVSIQNQAFEGWELICIDDFSTDGSKDIVMKFADIDHRIKLLNNEQKGIIPALQLGLRHAKGMYITRMDADDLMPENRLNLHIEMIEKSPKKTVVTGKVEYFSQKSVSPGYLKYQHWLNERVDRNDHFDHLYRECVIASPNWLIRKSELEDAAIFNNLIYPEDYDMVFQWRKHNFSVQCTKNITLFWREHPLRTSRNSTVYDQPSFFQLKLSWLAHLVDLSTKRIVLLGAGQKGKLIAKYLRDKDIAFVWHDLKSEQYNSPIYGRPIQSTQNMCGDLLLVSIYPDNREELEKFLQIKSFEIGKNAWYF